MARALLLAALALAPPSAAAEAELRSAAGSPRLIGILEAVPLAGVGRVRALERLDTHGYAAELEVESALVGTLERGARVGLAWEEPALGRPARFAEGDRVLVGLEPLPQQSIWAERIPAPERRLRTLAVAERGNAFLSRPSLGGLRILEHYLALLPEDRAGPGGTDYLAQLAEGAELPLARVAVVRLDGFAELDAALEPRSARRLVAALLRADADAALRDALLDLFAGHRPASVRQLLEAQLAAAPAPDPLVVAALGRIDGELETGRAKSLLENPDAELRTLGVRHAPAASARRLAALAATDPAPEVRSAAVTRLVALRGVSSIDAALVALDDPEPAVRAAAAHALGTLGAAPVPALRHIVDSGSPKAARAAVGALRWTQTREAHRELLEIATEHPDAGVRATARLALGRPLDADGH